MIMKGQDIYSSREGTTSSPSSSGNEDEVKVKSLVRKSAPMKKVTS